MSVLNESRYLDNLRVIQRTGEERADRTGTGTKSVFGTQTVYDLRDGFPLLTTKKVHFKSIVTELLWFLKGHTNTKFLHEHGCSIWDEWADKHGDLGPVYGVQWRSWAGSPTDGEGDIDQIAEVIKSIKADPFSRRHIVSAWSVHELEAMALPPCHLMFQFYVTTDGYLDCQLYQRSADMFLGVPFNIASYALLTMMVAQVCGLKPGRFVHVIGDAHIYTNHMDQVDEQLSRDVVGCPTVILDPDIMDIDAFTHESIMLMDYHPQPAIKAPVAV